VNRKHLITYHHAKFKRETRTYNKYLGRYFCYKCGKIGSVFATWIEFKLQGYSKIMSVKIEHTKHIYSKAKYQQKKKIYGKPNKGNATICKTVSVCTLY
jgi:hypothetical protein